MKNCYDDYSDLPMNAEYGSGSWKNENERFWIVAVNWAEMKNRLRAVDTPLEAVDIVRRMKGVSWEQLAREIGVARQTLTGWLKAKTIRFQQIVSICVALHLRGDIGGMLVEISECRTRIVPHREIYWYMIEKADRLTIDRCNEILALGNMPPLHCGEMLS